MGPDDSIPPLHGSYFGYAPSGSLRSHVTETVATLREVALMARDITPILPAEVKPTDDVVVLPGRGHNSLLFDPESITHVVDRVRKHQKPAKP